MSPRYRFGLLIFCTWYDRNPKVPVIPRGDVEVLRKEYVNFQRLGVRMNKVRIELENT